MAGHCRPGEEHQPRSSLLLLHRMRPLWTWLFALACLVGPGAAQSCRPELRDIACNLARGRPAFQSSLYTDTAFAVAGNAVDGKCDGQFLERSCTHTNADVGPWWYVDLGSQYVISAVVVKNRGDCCGERLLGAEIHVGDSMPGCVPGCGSNHLALNPICGTITDTALGSISTIHCKKLKGRYVSIVIPNRKEYLTVCEVEVYGSRVGDQC